MSNPLKELVNNYKDEYLDEFNEQLEKFKEIEDYNDLVYHSVFQTGTENIVCSQDNRLRLNLANNIYKCLTNNDVKKKITNSLCFTDILNVIYNVSQNNITKYFGCLNLYDCSLRIGSHFNIYPNKVYIHCGSLAGAKNLFKDNFNTIVSYFNEDKFFPYLDLSSLPTELQNLEPHYIEDFLCKFAPRLQKITIK